MKKKILVILSVLILLTMALTFIASAATESEFISAPKKELVLGRDYAYSFALVGDTQIVNLQDCKNGTKDLENLYTWIKNNQEAKNIKYVLGLGDITDTFKSSGTHYSAEWENAKSALSILDEAGIPYSLVRGNHDVSTGLNATFGLDSEYYSDLVSLSKQTDESGRPMAGFLGGYTDSTNTVYKIEDTYRKISFDGNNFLIVTLDWAPKAEVLTALNDLIASHGDYKVIVTIHQFLTKDGSFTDDIDATLPHEQIGDANWGEAAGSGGTELPRTVWDSVLSKHENVEMILCGHVETDDIVLTQLKGDKGNTVTSMLVNPQGMDAAIGNTGMVAMLYFTADGSVAHVEYISTVRDGDDSTDTGAYYKQLNQFSITMEHSSWNETPYGFVPTTEYNKYKFIAIVDDDGDLSTENYYLCGADNWITSDNTAGILPTIKTHFNYGGTAAKMPKNVYIVMTGNYDATSDGTLTSIGDIAGGIILDLNGNCFTTGTKPIFCAYTRKNDRSPRFEVRNGDVEISGNNSIFAMQTNAGNGGTLNVTLASVNVFYDEDGTGTTKNPVVVTYGGTAANNSFVNLMVSDCSFDFNGAPSGTVFINLNDANNNNDVSLVIKGGKVISNTASPAIFSLASDDTAVFGEGKDGYTSLLLPAGSAAPSEEYSSSEGKVLAFSANGSEGSYDKYTLSVLATEKYLVSANGDNVSFSGTGSYAKGEPVTLVFTPAEGYAVKSVTMSVAEGSASTVTLDSNNSYSFTMPEGKVEFTAVCEVITDDVSTKYGTIPAEYTNKEAYPFIVFKNGAFHSAYAKWNDFLAKGDSLLSRTATARESITLLLRRDYSTSEDTANSQNLYLFRGLVNIDLDGHTLTRGKYHLFQIMTKGGSTYNFSPSFNITNGTICGNNNSPLVINTNSSATVDDIFTFTFTDVTFNRANGSSLANLIFVTYSDGAKATNVDAVFNNCTFDSTTGSVNTTFFNLKESSGTEKHANIVINGGKIIGGATSKFTLCALANGDSVSFGKYNGAYTKLTFTDNGTVSSSFLNESGSVLELELTSSEGGYVYELKENTTFDTKYGKVPLEYENATAYPFLLFKDGAFLSAASAWSNDSQLGVLSDAKNALSANSTVTVLLRRDYTIATGKYNNLSQLTGIFVLDLDGHTLTTGTSPLFSANKKTANDTDIRVINGTILLFKGNLVSFGASAAGIGYKTTLTFTDVNVGFASGSTMTTVVTTFKGSDLGGYTYGDLVFNNCSFDLSTNAKSTATTIFNLAADADALNSLVDVQFNGGSINVESTSDIVIATFASGYGTLSDTLVFGKYNGSYVKVTAPAGSAAPLGSFTTTSGNYLFRFAAREDGKDVFTLAPSPLSELKVLSNVTLYSDFVCNVYISKIDGINSITLGNKVIDIASLEIITIDGKDYYVIRHSVASSVAANDSTLEISLKYGEDSYNGNWKVGVVRHAEALLASAQSLATDKLVCDMLSYIRSSYVYFATTGAVSEADRDAAVARIDALIGADYDKLNKPTINEAAALAVSGLKKASIYLGSKIAFAFYIEGNAEDYVFTVNGRVLESEVINDPNGCYILVTTYAYGIRDTINYSVTGTDISGSYNMKAYYDFISTEGNGSTELVNLIERLFLYSESAKNYRNEVIAK